MAKTFFDERFFDVMQRLEKNPKDEDAGKILAEYVDKLQGTLCGRTERPKYIPRTNLCVRQGNCVCTFIKQGKL